MWRNTQRSYGLIARLLHWLMAALVIFLFALGAWMVTLNYYHAWYQKAPQLHIGMGIIFTVVLVLRCVWVVCNPRPQINGGRHVQVVAKTVHRLFYVLMMTVVLAGYLLTTADGRAVSVWGWFEIPALWTNKGFEQFAGKAHAYLAYGLIALMLLHSLAALKHHFKDKDATLQRMWSGTARR